MSIELVKKGKQIKSDWYGKCEQCDAIFKTNEIYLQEISTRMGGDYRSDFEHWYKTNCSECNTPNSIMFYSKNNYIGLALFKESNLFQD